MEGIWVSLPYVRHERRLDHAFALVVVQPEQLFLQEVFVVFAHVEDELLDEGADVVQQADHHHEAEEDLHLLVGEVEVGLVELELEGGLEVGVGVVQAERLAVVELHALADRDVPLLPVLVEVADLDLGRLGQVADLVALR